MLLGGILFSSVLSNLAFAAPAEAILPPLKTTTTIQPLPEGDSKDVMALTDEETAKNSFLKEVGCDLEVNKLWKAFLPETWFKCASGFGIFAFSTILTRSLTGFAVMIQEMVGWVVSFSNNITTNVAFGKSLARFWTTMRNFSLSLLTMGIIVIAIANILNVDAKTYGLNNMLPKLILTVIYVTFSYTICDALLRVAEGLTAAVNPNMGEIILAGVSGTDTGVAGTLLSVGNLAGVLFSSLALFAIMLLGGLGLVILLVFRTYMLFLLIGIAPIAFVLNLLPFTDRYYKKWWGEFAKWVFMGPIAMLVLYVGIQIGTSAAPQNAYFAMFMMSISFLVAWIVPMSMGNALTKSTGKYMQNAAKNAWKNSTPNQVAKSFWASRFTNPKAQRAKEFSNSLQTSLAQSKNKTSQWIGGAGNPGALKAFEGTVLEEGGKAVQNLSAKEMDEARDAAMRSGDHLRAAGIVLQKEKTEGAKLDDKDHQVILMNHKLGAIQSLLAKDKGKMGQEIYRKLDGAPEHSGLEATFASLPSELQSTLRENAVKAAVNAPFPALADQRNRDVLIKAQGDASLAPELRTSAGTTVIQLRQTLTSEKAKEAAMKDKSMADREKLEKFIEEKAPVNL